MEVLYIFSSLDYPDPGNPHLGPDNRGSTECIQMLVYLPIHRSLSLMYVHQQELNRILYLMYRIYDKITLTIKRATTIAEKNLFNYGYKQVCDDSFPACVCFVFKVKPLNCFVKRHRS